MRVKFTILESENLALIKLKGDYAYEPIIEIITTLNHKIIKNGLNKCIIDLREAYFVFHHHHIQDIYSSANMRDPALKHLKTVFLTSNPKTTIYTLLYKQQIEQNRGSAIQCSTLDYAIQLLSLKSAKEQIESILMQDIPVNT